MTETVFGPVVSTWDVEQAVIKTLREWTNEYLRDIEVKRELARKQIPRPPAYESYHGGVDEETWDEGTTPQVIVAVKPQGAPELRGNGGYAQGYDITVGCVFVSTGGSLAERAEDDARAVVSYLGAASMLLCDQPTLGGLAERVRLTTATTVSLPNPDRRDLALSTTTFELWVATIFEEGVGPVTVGKEPEEPYPAEPEVKTQKETVTAESVGEPIH